MSSIFICASKEGRGTDVMWRADLTSILYLKKRVTLGRNSTSCDFGLDHPSLSRVHAEISQDNDGNFFVSDLGSTHGTFLNGEKLIPNQRTPFIIDSNDVVMFGASTRKYYLSSTVDGKYANNDNDNLYNPGKGSAEDTTESQRKSERIETNANKHLRNYDRDQLRAAIASFSAPIITSMIRHPLIHEKNETKDEEGTRDDNGLDEEFDEVDDEDDKDKDATVYDKNEEEEEEPERSIDLPLAFGARPGHQHLIGKKRSRPVDDVDHDSKTSIDDDLTIETSLVKNRHHHTHNQLIDGLDAVISRCQLPISHSVSLRGHNKAVTCVAFDPSGSRVATASSDSSLRLYNFAGMDSSHSAFRVITPQEGQGVRSVSYSSNGDRFAVATTSAHANVFDRDSRPLVKTVKGDPYIADSANTRGHTAALSHAQFHPLYRDTLVTSSLDGTVRLWDMAGGKLAFNELICGDIIKFKNSKGQRAGVTAASVTQDGKSVIAGTEDGALHLVHLRQPSSGSSSGITGHKYVRTDALVRDSEIRQGEGGGISTIVFSPDGVRFATRHGSDDRLKIWDLRKFSGEKSTPLVSLSKLSGTLESAGVTANCAWSPDGKTLIAGIAMHDKQHPAKITSSTVMSSSSSSSKSSGRVLFFDLATLETSSSSIPDGNSGNSSSLAYYQASVEGGSSAVCVNWNAKINQIAVGCGDGTTRILYNPTLSTAGALLSSSRAPKRITVDDWAASAASEASGTLAIVPGESQGKKLSRQQQQQQRAEQEASEIQPRKIDKSSLLDSGKRTFTEHFLAVNVKGNLREEDPQAVLQRYASSTSSVGGGFTSAYKLTQPVTILAGKTAEEEIDEIEAAKAARRNKT
jgi:WD repeat-containing protein 70